MKTYKRAIKLKSYATAKKRSQVMAIIRRYRKQVNLFINYCWNNPEAKLNKLTLSSVDKVQSLSERYKSNALKQALSLCNNSMTKSKPKFIGYPILDAKFIDIKPSKKSGKFDLWIKLSTLKSGKPIYLPTKKHRQLNRWLSGGTLINGCELRPDGFIVWIEHEVEPTNENGLDIGIDIGMNKLIATSYGELIGTDWYAYNAKILRKKKNSKAYKRAIIENKNYINRCVKGLPWNLLKSISYENLKNLKKGNKKRSKKFRIKQQHWSYRQIIEAVKMKAQTNRVRLIYVNPAYTSQTCSACGNVAASSRDNEDYCCVKCGYTQDADINGAINILHKGQSWITSLESVNSKSKISFDI